MASYMRTPQHFRECEDLACETKLRQTNLIAMCSTFLQVPLQPGVGASLRPKNAIYLRVKERAL